MDRVHKGGPWTGGPCFVYVRLEPRAIEWQQGADSVLNTEIDSRQNVQPTIFGLGKRNIKNV